MVIIKVFQNEQLEIPVDDRTVSVVQSFNTNEDDRVAIPRVYVQKLVQENFMMRTARNCNYLFAYCVLLCRARMSKKVGANRKNPVVIIKQKDYQTFFGADVYSNTTDKCLRALQEKGLIRVQKTKKSNCTLVYLLKLGCFVKSEAAYNTERHAIYNQSGFVILPRKIYEQHFEKSTGLGGCDIAMDLLFHCVYNDERYPLSQQGYPIVLYDNVQDHRAFGIQGQGVTSARALAQRWNTDQRTISRLLADLEALGLLSRQEVHKRGTVLALPNYFHMCYDFRQEAAACEKAKECKQEQFQYWKEAKGLGRAPCLRSKQLNKIWGIVKLQNRHLEDKEHVSCLLAMSYDIRKRIAGFLEDLVNVAITTFQKAPARAVPLLC